MPTIKHLAVRWDWLHAFTTSTDASVQERTGKTAVHNALEHPDFHYRAPSWSRVVAPHKLEIDSGAAAMEIEIQAAFDGGLSGWMFLRYPTDAINDGFNRGLAIYQASPNKAKVPWCSLEGTATLGTPASNAAQVSRLVAEMGQEHYFKVLGGRPLLGLYGNGSGWAAHWGSLAAFKTVIDSIRSSAQAAGLANPYVVAYCGPEGATATALGADAISDYIGNPSLDTNVTYAAQDARTRAYWATLAAAFPKIVPPAMAGWNRAPRKRRPDWSNGARTSAGAIRHHGWRPYMGIAQEVAEATAAELAAHAQAATDYCAANPAVCEAQVVTWYNWCENSEGGYLMPTLGVPAGKLSWIKAVLLAS